MCLSERIDVANRGVRAVLGMAANLSEDGWVPVGDGCEGPLYFVSLEHEPREAATQAVRPVAEQARALGLRRARGTSDCIWSGTFLEEGKPCPS